MAINTSLIDMLIDGAIAIPAWTFTAMVNIWTYLADNSATLGPIVFVALIGVALSAGVSKMTGGGFGSIMGKFK